MSLLNPGTILESRYEILGVLGEGGMGAVYRVADLRLNRKHWALKEVLLRAEGEEAIPLRQEADILSALENEHLPRIVDYFESDVCGYLVMELVEGDTLDKKVRQHGPLAVAEVLRLAAQLCDTLEYLHTHQPPIIFRDLKPANVMVTPKGQVKLIDFGIARLFAKGQDHDTVALGTPGYAAPEQYGKAQTDVRTDVYGLGATLYFASSGLDPADQTWPLKPLKSAFPTLPRALSDVLEKCTALDAAARFDTMKATRQAFAAVAEEPAKAVPTQALPTRPPAPPRPSWFARKPAAPPPPLVVSPARVDFGHVNRRTTQLIPLSIQGPKVKIKSDTPWVKVRKQKGVWFAEVDPRAVPSGGTHQGTIRVVGPSGTQHVPVRVQLHPDAASPFLKMGFFFLTVASLIPAVGLLFYLVALFVYLSNSRDVRQQVGGFVTTASLIAAANVLFSGLAWVFLRHFISSG